MSRPTRPRSSCARRFVPAPPSALEPRALLSNYGFAPTPAREISRTPAATTDLVLTPVVRPAAAAPSTPARGPYTPAQVRHAYGIDALAGVGLTGAGQTIAIVDAYDDPTVARDLHTFDAAYHLPDPKFVKATPEGTPAYDPAWAGEIALDVEWAHAIAPGATILLVEAVSSSPADLFGAVSFAVAHGAKEVSMSWGFSGYPGVTANDPVFDHPGVSFTAAAGDTGAWGGSLYPASSPFVTAVGGTSLALDANGKRLSEGAWGYGGGGQSDGVARPSYQAGFLGGAGRGTPDVAWDADPSTGVSVYSSSNGQGWYDAGGTSAGAPQWAGLLALVNQGRAAWHKPALGTGLPFGTNQALYALAGGSRYTNPRGDFLDIVSGNNGYPAARGYDLATGLGSPVANKLASDLIFS